MHVNVQLAKDSKSKVKEETSFVTFYEYEFNIEYYPNGQIAKQTEGYGKEKYFDINGVIFQNLNMNHRNFK